MDNSEDLFEEQYKKLAERIAKLRADKGLSARNMSLSMGQGKQYINNLESRNSKPSLDGVFLICEYLNITPSEFFDTENPYPSELATILEDLKKLSPEHIQNISSIIKGLITI